MSVAVIWLFPDCDSESQRVIGAAHWAPYAAAAGAAGLDFLGPFSAEAVDVIHDPSDVPRVLVDGRLVSPADTIFVTDLYLFPYQVPDTWLHMSTFWVLKELGFYLPVPPELSILVNDKLATNLHVQRLGLPVPSSTRITAGRDWDRRDLADLTAHLTFPLAVKPTSWGGGLGFTIARDLNDLRGLVSLASGATVSLLVQNCVNPAVLVDYRVVAIDGEPVIAMGRATDPGGVVASVNRGGRAWLEDVPAPLVEHVKTVAASFGVPFLCVDFLFDGKDYWFSELELDGGIIIDDDRTLDVHAERFRAFARGHERWLAS